MYATPFLTIALAAFASAAALPESGNSTVKRGCWTGGEEWGQNKVYALNYATQACTDAFVGNRNREGGAQYNKGDNPGQCYNLDEGTKVDFSIKIEKVGPDGHHYLKQDACADGLRAQVSGCDKYGGVQTTDGVTYRADPGEGQCAQ